MTHAKEVDSQGFQDGSNASSNNGGGNSQVKGCRGDVADSENRSAEMREIIGDSDGREKRKSVSSSKNSEHSNEDVTNNEDCRDEVSTKGASGKSSIEDCVGDNQIQECCTNSNSPEVQQQQQQQLSSEAVDDDNDAIHSNYGDETDAVERGSEQRRKKVKRRHRSGGQRSSSSSESENDHRERKTVRIRRSRSISSSSCDSDSGSNEAGKSPCFGWDKKRKLLRKHRLRSVFLALAVTLLFMGFILQVRQHQQRLTCLMMASWLSGKGAHSLRSRDNGH